MASSQQLNLSDLPPVFILPTHLETDDLHEAEDALYHARGRLSYRATEARIFLGKVSHKKRAVFDLRARGLWSEEDLLPPPPPNADSNPKRRKIDKKEKDKDKDKNKDKVGSRSLSDSDPESGQGIVGGSKRKRTSDQPNQLFPDLTNHIIVLKLEWLDACAKADERVPFQPYLIYAGRIVPKPPGEKRSSPSGDEIKAISEAHTQPNPVIKVDPSILERAKADAASVPVSSHSGTFHRRKFGQQSTSPHQSHPPKLHRATTSELRDAEPSKLPPVPSWLNDEHPRPLYSCLRSTPPIEDSPNYHFIAQLMKIKEARLLTLDEIGVRAYSTSIASLAAYPYRIISPVEVSRLPGCNDKIATLWVEWHDSVSLSDISSPEPETNSETVNQPAPLPPTSSDRDAALDASRTIPIVRDLEADTDLTHLRTFYTIWGVGAETARKFYFTNGWQELDDIVEFGWSTLSRSQQIGVKFYDEFQQLIPKTEVEDIARTVIHHARTCRSIPRRHWTNDVVQGTNGATAPNTGDPRDFVAVIVGGYRRGKPRSGDVDIILSHRDERMTKDLVVDVVRSLESDSWITHTLTLHTTTSDRGQSTLPYRNGGGHGFDSLDKALCVWQDPDPRSSQPTNTPSPTPLSPSPKKNPNIHRRVDIIVSPWRTVGCAVLGWSGGTTFQRDIRRWAKRERGWKFDSSGVRDRGNGMVIDLESPREGDWGDGWQDRERRVMEGLGIGWRPAGERCTG